MGGKSQSYQQCVHVEVNLIYMVLVAKKEARFVIVRHNDLRELTAEILSEVCNNTEIEPKLIPLNGEHICNRK